MCTCLPWEALPRYRGLCWLAPRIRVAREEQLEGPVQIAPLLNCLSIWFLYESNSRSVWQMEREVWGQAVSTEALLGTPTPHVEVPGPKSAPLLLQLPAAVSRGPHHLL